MTPLKNFFHVLKKYKIASLLNVIGLSIAFASFMIIMTQVKYDLSFDRHYKNADRIFRVENQAMTENGKYSANTSRLVAEKVFAAEPEIEKTGLIQSYQQFDIYDQSLGKDSRQGPFHFYTAEPDALDILEFEFVHGSPQRFSESGTVLISEQVATAIYGDQNPVGRSLIFDKDTEHPVEIVGVYKNFPQNATIRSNSIVRFIGQENAGNGNNWNYVYYIRLNARENAEQVMQAMNKKYQEFVGTGNSVPDNFFRLTPITETHFTQSVSYSPTDTGNRATVYSLMSIGVLIILIAMINFVNFSTSLIPTRIRSINVQKERRHPTEHDCGIGGTRGRLVFRCAADRSCILRNAAGIRHQRPVRRRSRYADSVGHGAYRRRDRNPVRNIPGFLQHLVRSGARSERRFRAYPERTPFAHGTDIGTVRDIDHIDHRHAVDTRTKPLHAKIRYGVPT